MKHIVHILILFISFLTISCSSDEASPYNSNKNATLTVEFDNIVGSSDLQLNTGTYQNALNQEFTITMFKYFVSNFKLTNVNGTVYTVPQDSCYFLMDESDPNSLTAKLNVPEGEYKTISFIVGVDSLRNTMDVSKRTGVLDVAATAKTMYWSWNSGYIFLKMEGTSPSVDTMKTMGMGNVFQFHIGGFGGYSTPMTNNVVTVTLDLTSRGTPKVKSGNEAPNLHLLVDALKMINGTTNVDFSTSPMVHSPTPGKVFRDNYQNMFTHDHTEQ